MKNLLIIGARGFGRDIYYLASQCSDYQNEFVIKGFLDDKVDALDEFKSYQPIVDSVEDYIVGDDDVFICALGDVQQKKKYTQMILDKGGKFISLIHPSAYVDPNAKMGAGCIVSRFAGLGSGSIIGDYVLIQGAAFIGHDVKIGNYSRVDCHVVCTGGAIIEDEVTIHTSAIISQNVLVQKGAHIGAGSFVIRTVKENSTVYGNPAIRLK